MTLEDEKLKVLYEHRLQVWRIVIEKGLLGILLGLAVLAANMLIEDFKSDLSRQRFLLESRLTALQALRESYSLLSNHLWHLAREDKATSEKRLLPAYGKDLAWISTDPRDTNTGGSLSAVAHAGSAGPR